MRKETRFLKNVTDGSGVSGAKDSPGAVLPDFTIDTQAPFQMLETRDASENRRLAAPGRPEERRDPP
jgi:hypothetical protein